MISVNNKILLQPYEGSNKIEANVSSGFATIKQKSSLIGLKLLVDAEIDGKLIKKNSTVLIEEVVLSTSPWAKKTYECSEIKERFIIADKAFVIAVKEIKK